MSRGWKQTKNQMQTKLRQTTGRRSSRQLLRRRTPRHDPMFLLNMSLFNFTDEWAGFFPKSNMDASPPDDSMQTIGSAPIEMNAARESVVVKARTSAKRIL